MVRALKLIKYKERPGQLTLFSWDRRKLKAGASSCCFLLLDRRKTGKMKPVSSERCTMKGQHETIATGNRNYFIWKKENGFAFRGVQ